MSNNSMEINNEGGEMKVVEDSVRLEKPESRFNDPPSDFYDGKFWSFRKWQKWMREEKRRLSIENSMRKDEW